MRVPLSFVRTAALLLIYFTICSGDGTGTVRGQSAFALSELNGDGVRREFVREQQTTPQPAILSTTLASNRIVILPDAHAPGTQILVPGLPADATPHGVAYFGSDNALVTDGGHSRIFVVQISTATLVSTIDTAAEQYDGSGTIAVAPDGSVALAMGSTGVNPGRFLRVIHAPFGPASTITTVDVPGNVAQAQTQAIVFDGAGRAFIRSSGGISVLDPPYTSVAFRFPVFGPGTSGSGAIAISPDGNTLLTTCACGSTDANVLKIFRAPFSDTSTPINLVIPNGDFLDGIAVAPDGGSAILVSPVVRYAAVITAPFNFDSTVEPFILPPGTEGFEDVGISADSQIAILTGQSLSEPPVFVRAPFTAAGAVLTNVPIAGVPNPARGQGAVRFRPAAAMGPLQLTAAVSRKSHGGAGTFDVPLALAGEPGVECRSSGGNHTLVFTFSNDVTSGDASVTSGTGSVSGSPTFAGPNMTLNLIGVTDVQKITVNLSNVTDEFAQVLPATSVSVNMLVGDTTGNKMVNTSDIGQTKTQSGLAPGPTTFRTDVTVSGMINTSDIGLVKSRSGFSVP